MHLPQRKPALPSKPSQPLIGSGPGGVWSGGGGVPGLGSRPRGGSRGRGRGWGSPEAEVSRLPRWLRSRARGVWEGEVSLLGEVSQMPG